MTRNATTFAALFCTSGAILFSCVGIFLKEWWIDAAGNKHDLFTTITCEEYVCSIPEREEVKSDVWIQFALVSGLTQWALLLVALVLQVIGMCNIKPCVIAAMVALSLACLTIFFHTFVTIAHYFKMSSAYHNKFTMPPKDHVLYQTLPVGLNSIAAIFAFPAIVALGAQERGKRDGYPEDKGNGVDTMPVRQGRNRPV